MSGAKCIECKLEYDPLKHLISKSRDTRTYVCDDCDGKTRYSYYNIFGPIKGNKCLFCDLTYDRTKDRMVKIKGYSPICSRCYQRKQSSPDCFAIFVKGEWDLEDDELYNFINAVHSHESHWVDGVVFTRDNPMIQKLFPLMKCSGVSFVDAQDNMYKTRDRLPIPDNWENIPLDAARVALNHYSSSFRDYEHSLDDANTLKGTPEIARMLAQISLWTQDEKDIPPGYRPLP